MRRRGHTRKLSSMDDRLASAVQYIENVVQVKGGGQSLQNHTVEKLSNIKRLVATTEQMCSIPNCSRGRMNNSELRCEMHVIEAEHVKKQAEQARKDEKLRSIQDYDNDSDDESTFNGKPSTVVSCQIVGCSNDSFRSAFCLEHYEHYVRK